MDFHQEAAIRTYEDATVHLRHFKDGYPLCWPMDKDGKFEGSFKESEVTCKKCLQIRKE